VEGPAVSARPMRIPDRVIRRYPHAAAPPGHHTRAEIHQLTTLLCAARVRRIAIGHGRHCTSIAAAAAVNAAWAELGGVVEQIVSWPDDAASWLRPARRLVTGQPDAWIIADNPAGWAQLAPRLAEHDCWSPARTFGCAALGNPVLLDLTGEVLTGMTGATADGGGWRIIGRSLILDDSTDRPPG
jgi:hypothetical protein